MAHDDDVEMQKIDVITFFDNLSLQKKTYIIQHEYQIYLRDKHVTYE